MRMYSLRSAYLRYTPSTSLVLWQDRNQPRNLRKTLHLQTARYALPDFDGPCIRKLGQKPQVQLVEIHSLGTRSCLLPEVITKADPLANLEAKL